MDKDFRFNISMFERFEREMKRTSGFEPHMMLKNKNGTPFLVKVSDNPNPARWMVVGDFFDATFFTYKDLRAFIDSHGLEVWTEADDRVYGRKLSNICNSSFRYEL